MRCQEAGQQNEDLQQNEEKSKVFKVNMKMVGDILQDLCLYSICIVMSLLTLLIVHQSIDLGQ